MGAGSRARAKEKRKAEKRKRKAAKTAQYEAWRHADQNLKSKRFLKKGKKKLLKAKHTDGPCGNVGCMKCSALFQEDGPLHWAKKDHEFAKLINSFGEMTRRERLIRLNEKVAA
jgi:hypothetical protein